MPRRFRRELPNPYPGEDQSKWGYPITLQLGPRKKGGAPVVAITLHEGNRDAAPVDCFLSSPQKPGNPLLVPELTWCLIPKSHLKAGTKHYVKAVFSGDESRTLSWSCCGRIGEIAARTPGPYQSTRIDVES